MEQQLAENRGVLYYRSRNSQKSPVHPFIKLEEPISYQAYWRGGVLTFNAGDYIHADPHDIYGLTAETFARCYIPADAMV